METEGQTIPGSDLLCDKLFAFERQELTTVMAAKQVLNLPARTLLRTDFRKLVAEGEQGKYISICWF